MRFSIVIPTYNRRPLLERALGSALAQTWRDTEIIVVDDGSTDGTAAWLRVAAARLIVLAQANRGPSAARNLGLSRASGDYVVFLDSDDLLLPDALCVYARAIEAAGSPSLISGRLGPFPGAAPPARSAGAPSLRTYENYLAAAANHVYAGACQLVARRDALLAAGGFDESLRVAEDHDLVLRLGRKPGFVEILAPETVLKRVHEGSISRNGALAHHGLMTLVRRARSGAYGRSARERLAARTIVGAHVRAGAVRLLKSGAPGKGGALYLASLGLNARQRRWKFVAGFPLHLAWCWVKALVQRAPLGASGPGRAA